LALPENPSVRLLSVRRGQTKQQFSPRQANVPGKQNQGFFAGSGSKIIAPKTHVHLFKLPTVDRITPTHRRESINQITQGARNRTPRPRAA
jgi:hypothetical protein